MILQDIFTTNPRRDYDRLKAILAKYGVQTSVYESMETNELRRSIEHLNSRKSKILSNLPFDKELKDPRYSITVLESAAVKSLLDEKTSIEDQRPLIKNITYYRRTIIEGNKLTGYRCTYLGPNRPANWTKIVEDVRTLKALELIKHGSDEDFARIYFIMADGVPNHAARKACYEHIAYSSDKAKKEIAKYCDARWEGAWPWEAVAPSKLKKIIERKHMNRNRRIAEMRARLSRITAALYEGEVEKSEVILSGREMADKLTSMIHELGKLSAQLMAEFKDQVRTEFGAESANGLTEISSDKISHAVDALGEIKSSIDTYLQGLQGGGTGNGMPSGSPDGGGLDMGGSDGKETKPAAGLPGNNDPNLDLPDMGDEDGGDGSDGEGSDDFDIGDLDLDDMGAGGNERKKKSKKKK